jgi:predicted lipid-binding transport protein (Tim44 family)
MSAITVFTRTGVAALGLCLAGATLSACAPVDGTNAAGSAGATSQSTVQPSASTTTAAVVTLPAAVQTTVAAAATTPAAPAAPTTGPSTCPSVEQEFVHIDSVSVDPATGLNRITAEKAEIQCGPGVEDDQQFVTIGSPATYDVSTAVKVTLANLSGASSPGTWHELATGNLSEFGGYFGIDFNNAGLITVIDEYFHP